ncbi:hypothetical protein SAMN02745157_0107 [Kaistia soli DSM 19436]|uniref:Phasin protein n=1 Tax=Kaistia soli DSM 19436 TaxID=1122133 RepID=A0A1M5PAJ8_9HYPH|nr:hypothetical protein [Kaistia soli]SHG98762.1 hypothetical protein SAMN02745157_0107 [Kaistia soli DSM 19436]
MATINIDQLAGDIVDALRGEITTGFQAISTFARNQSRRLAAQAALIAEGGITGQLDAEMLRFFDDQLKTMARNFARAVAERTMITLQRAWNAITDVVWGAVNAALGTVGIGGLPMPALGTR